MTLEEQDRLKAQQAATAPPVVPSSTNNAPVIAKNLDPVTGLDKNVYKTLGSGNSPLADNFAAWNALPEAQRNIIQNTGAYGEPGQHTVIDPGKSFETTDTRGIDKYGGYGMTPEQITAAARQPQSQASGNNPNLTAVSSYIPTQGAENAGGQDWYVPGSKDSLRPFDISPEMSLQGQRGGLLTSGEVVSSDGRIFRKANGAAGMKDTGQTLGQRQDMITGQINAGDVNSGGKVNGGGRQKMETQAVRRLQDSMNTDIVDQHTLDALDMIPGATNANKQLVQNLMDKNAGLKSNLNKDYWQNDAMYNAGQLGNIQNYQDIVNGKNLVSEREARNASERARATAMSSAVSGVGGPMAGLAAGMANSNAQRQIAADAAVAAQKERNDALAGVQSGLQIGRQQGLTQSGQSIDRDKSLDTYEMDKYGNQERATGAMTAANLSPIELNAQLGGQAWTQRMANQAHQDELAGIVHAIANGQRLEPGMLQKYSGELMQMGGAVANATSNLLGKVATAGSRTV